MAGRSGVGVRAMIAVEDLIHTYPRASTPTLKGLSFEVGRGEVLGLLGPSGSGKSTTQKILIGLLSGFQGRVEVMGRPVSSWGSALYQHVGVAFENPNDHYLKLSARENLRFFAAMYERSASRDRIDHLLEVVDLHDDADKPVAEFSKGMRVRLNVARSLVHRPELLFLDEPTSGLDPGTARRVKDLIKDLRDGGTTVFLCTHDMTVAEDVCDRVAFLVDGRIALIDAPRALKLAHGRRLVRVECGRDGQLESREFPIHGLADDGEFLGWLARDDLQTIHTQETTLERIFLEVTGTHLR